MNIGTAIGGLGRPVAYYPSLARCLGGVNAALLLCQLIYWRGKGRYGDTIYKTADELTEETGLTYREQLTARKKLRGLGILQERYDRLRHQTYFNVDLTALDRVFRAGEHSHKVTVASVTSRQWRQSQSDGGDSHKVTVDIHRLQQRVHRIQKEKPSLSPSLQEKMREKAQKAGVDSRFMTPDWWRAGEESIRGRGVSTNAILENWHVCLAGKVKEKEKARFFWEDYGQYAEYRMNLQRRELDVEKEKERKLPYVSAGEVSTTSVEDRARFLESQKRQLLNGEAV